MIRYYHIFDMCLIEPKKGLISKEFKNASENFQIFSKEELMRMMMANKIHNLNVVFYMFNVSKDKRKRFIFSFFFFDFFSKISFKLEVLKHKKERCFYFCFHSINRSVKKIPDKLLNQLSFLL